MQKISNFISKISEKRKLLIAFIIFLIIQPILDIYILFTDEVINIFIFSPATIIRMLVIGVLFIILLFTNKNKKHIKYFIIYGIVFAIYTGLHIYNCINIDNNINPNYRVSILSEFFYLIRMLLPLLVIYISYNLKMDFKSLSKIIISVILIFSIIVVVTHLLKISFKSYSEQNVVITQNIIDWFFNEDQVVNQNESLSKGWFRGANQLGNLLIMLLPISLYITVKQTNKLNCFTVFIQIFSCIIIGTRIASYLWIPIIICVAVIIAYFIFIKKELKPSKSLYIFLIVTLLLNTLILSKSPAIERKISTDYNNSIDNSKQTSNITQKSNNLEERINNEKDPIKVKELKKEFLLENYEAFGIMRSYIFDTYNYQYDTDFWMDITQKESNEINDGRKMQFLIAERLFEINDRILDKLVGIGFTTTRNGSLYTELDYIAHYYTIGLVGSALLLYIKIVLLIIVIIFMFKRYKEKFTFENVIYVMSLCLIFLIALLSAHVLDELVVTIFIGFIMGQLLNNIFMKEENNA